MIGHKFLRAATLAFVAFCAIGESVADEPTISVEARQRYPWNGLVDIKFTVTGESNVKYDTSFTIKDVVGGTNLTMRNVRKSDGTAVNVAKEYLQPGTYNWIWYASADLPKDFECEKVTVSGVIEKGRDKVQLWEGGPYWATTNIGAEKPEDSGYYFWWGDTVGYKRENEKWVASDGSDSNFSFLRDNALTYDKSVSTLKSEGWITVDGVLATEHDAANIHWGNGWRMPTKAEFDALNNNCDWTRTTMNGISGYVVSGRDAYASNRIFLSAVGRAYDTSLLYVGSRGYFWSAVLNSYNNEALYFCFFSSSHDGISHGTRDYGMPIRPVQSYVK